MPTKALSSRTWSKVENWMARTGRRPTSEIIRGLAEADLAAQSDRINETGRMELSAKELSLKEDGLKANARAATMSGVIQTATAIPQTYLAYKAYTGGTTGAQTGGYLARAGTALGFGSQAAAQGSGAAMGSAYGAGPIGATFAHPATVSTATGGTSAALSAVAPYAGVAGAGFVAGHVGGGVMERSDTLQKLTPWGGDATEGKMGGVAAGAATGAAIGSVVIPIPGVGTVIGGIIGGIAGFAGASSVICTELYRQKRITKKMLYLSAMYKQQYVDDATYAGYLTWATPLVKVMQASKLISFVMVPFWTTWAQEMSHIMDNKYKRSILGKIIIKIGTPISRFIGNTIRGENYGNV